MYQSDYIQTPTSPTASTLDFLVEVKSEAGDRAHSRRSTSLASGPESLYDGPTRRRCTGARPAREYRPRSSAADGENPFLSSSTSSSSARLAPEVPPSLVAALRELGDATKDVRRSNTGDVVLLGGSSKGDAVRREEAWQMILSCLFDRDPEELVKQVKAIICKIVPARLPLGQPCFYLWIYHRKD